ncbi:MAG: glucokinase [Chlamydiales bacterium]|nr:glucokinase [Chlamydiales bacterium]
MYLAADVGGTKTHLAIYESTNCKLQSIKDKKYPSKNYPNITNILQEFLSDFEGKIEKICIGIAGPVKNGICKTTNLPWVVDIKEVCKRLNITYGAIINDLEANAYGIKMLTKENFYCINKGVETLVGNQALISAGTGLGEAGIFFNGKQHIPFACEGGHCDFAPKNELEVDLLRFLMKRYGAHISFERVLCGRGIYEIYQFLTETKREIKCADVDEQIKRLDPPKIISEAGVKGECKACRSTLEVFCSIYGSEAGNCALKFMALGGVFIGGGIAPKILTVLKNSDFLTSFVGKGRFEEFLSQIPINIVLNENTALLGAAFFCENCLNN